MKISFVVAEDENLGVEYLSNALKKNRHQVELVFFPNQFGKGYVKNKWLANFFNWQDINLRELKRQNPDLIAFSCVTATYDWAHRFSRIVKKELNKPIIFGGTHPTLKPEVVMSNDAVDMVCVGEGEEAIVELANSLEAGEKRQDIKNIWFRFNGNIIKNPVRPLKENIDDYEMDRELFFKKLPSNYRTSAYFLTSRGCPFNCTYCGNEQKRKVYSGLTGKYVRQKSVARAIEELKKLKNLGTTHVLFVDDVLTMDKKWFVDFIERYKNEIALPFTCFVHAKLFDESLARLLKDGGCKLVWYGIQTGSERVRKEILARYESNSEIIRASDICRKYKLKYMIDHIFDIPQDDNIKESIDLYNKIRPQMLNCYNLLYFPSAKIIEHALAAKLVTTQDIEKIDRGQDIVYQTGSISSNDGKLRSNYRRYALLLTAIPILPKWLVSKMCKGDSGIKFFGRLPLIFIPLIKVVLNFRVGHGFIPLAVLKTELFWMKKFFQTKFLKSKD